MSNETTKTTAIHRISRRLPFVLAIGAAALMVAPASGMAKSATFGADVNPTVQPSNAGTAHDCDVAPGEKCTWILNDAYGDPGNEGAPKEGTLKRIELIAGEAGSFKLQTAKVKADGSAKVRENGPKISYQGQPESFDEPYNVESFKVDVPVKKGDHLAIRTASTSTLRCSSGGDNTLLFAPPLSPGGPFEIPSDGEGCWLLIQGTVKY